MFKNRHQMVILCLAAAVLMVASISLSHWLAPKLASGNDLNPYNFLYWGAPALFHEDMSESDEAMGLEPWELLGLQLPVFSLVSASDFRTIPVDIEDPEPILPVSPEPPPTQTVGTGEIVVGIYHSHSHEGYRDSNNLIHRNWRSTDPNTNIVAIGTLLSDILSNNGITVVHSKFDHEGANGYPESYHESRVTAKQMLKDYPEIALLLDVHRDALGTVERSRSVSTATISGESVAKIMFVVSGNNPHFNRNFRIANDITNFIEDRYPGLTREVHINNNARSHTHLNQDLHESALLVEVGTYGNTLEEAKRGAELFAEVLIEYLMGGNGDR